HTCFTGTSLWLDPHTKSYVIFLSNRVHPDGKGDVTALRGKVATIAAGALYEAADLESLPADAWRSAFTASDRAHPERAATRGETDAVPTLAGIDVLQAEGFAPLRGKRIGLLTNHTGRTRSGRSTIDALAAAPDVTLVALFSPEHGIRGEADEKVASSRDEKTGAPAYSLSGEWRRPTGDM